MPEHEGPRDGTRTDGGEAGDLAARVEEMERQLIRTQSRLRALTQVVAAGHGHLFREAEALLKTG